MDHAKSFEAEVVVLLVADVVDRPRLAEWRRKRQIERVDARVEVARRGAIGARPTTPAVARKVHLLFASYDAAQAVRVVDVDREDSLVLVHFATNRAGYTRSREFRAECVALKTEAVAVARQRAHVDGWVCGILGWGKHDDEGFRRANVRADARTRVRTGVWVCIGVWVRIGGLRDDRCKVLLDLCAAFFRRGVDIE